jgi:hypothetical protein
LKFNWFYFPLTDESDPDDEDDEAFHPSPTHNSTQEPENVDHVVSWVMEVSTFLDDVLEGSNADFAENTFSGSCVELWVGDG